VRVVGIARLKMKFGKILSGVWEKILSCACVVVLGFWTNPTIPFCTPMVHFYKRRLFISFWVVYFVLLHALPIVIVTSQI